VGCAAVAMACRSQLEGRPVAILDSGVNQKAPQRAFAWAAAVATVLLVAPLAAVRAQNTETIPADVDATIRAAAAQKNHEMLEGAAQAAEAYRKYDLARQLLDSSLTIRGEVSGQQSVQYGIGLIKIADLELSRHNLAEADNFYTKAVSVLGNRPEAAPALIHLGLLALQKAYDYFQQAQVADPSKADSTEVDHRPQPAGNGKKAPYGPKMQRPGVSLLKNRGPSAVATFPGGAVRA
jgi:tetratricopeptide (TPR) repeat protein